MRIVVFEWLTGGGLIADQQEVNVRDPMWRQGAAMALALAEDLSAVGHDVTIVLDDRLDPQFAGPFAKPVFARAHHERTLLTVGQQADWTWIVAPESGGRLRQVCQLLASADIPLLNPSIEWIAWASSKQAVAESLAQCQLQPDEGLIYPDSSGRWPPVLAPPAVIKPDDGAGSEGLQWVGSWDEISPPAAGRWRIEPYYSGVAVSVAMLSGRSGRALLEPFYQQFDRSPFGHYVGGTYPVEAAIRERALERAREVWEAFPPKRGFVGMDLVIDLARPPRADRVVDINPRLTSSYLGLRRIYAENLADWVVRLAQGEMVAPQLSLKLNACDFTIH